MTSIEVNVYPPGNEITCTGTITDAGGNPYNPATLLFHVTNPQGVKTTYTYGTDDEIAHPAAGEYVLTLLVDYSNDIAGTWIYGIQGLNSEGQSIFFLPRIFQVSKTGTL